MKKVIIDTDTASDDAVALVMALSEPELEVIAITTVAGNVTVETATRNALISIDAAGTYAPPVYEGMGKPMFRDHRSSVAVKVNTKSGIAIFSWLPTIIIYGILRMIPVE